MATAPADDALAAPELKRVVAVLAVTVITSYGVLYYAFAALSSSIAADTGWSSVEVTGAFSLSQLVAATAGIWVGRHIDRVGPRRVMTAGSLLALPAVTAVALAHSLAVFYAGWLLAGVAMAGLLYPPAFATLTHWGGARRLGALTTLTLVAGLASTVFAPVASWANQWWGWRVTYLVLLAVLLVITVPLHWCGLNRPWRPSTQHPEVALLSGDEAPSFAPGIRPIILSGPFLILTLAFTMSSLAIYAGIINQVPLLEERGLSPNVAAVALGLAGFGQVLGRLGYAALVARTTVTTRAVAITIAVAVTTAVLAVTPAATPLLLVLAVLVGLARGLETLVQATAITDRWGPEAYGSLNGIMTAPPLVAAASAPFVGAALAHLLGSYADAFLVLAAVAVLASALMLGTRPRTTPRTPWMQRPRVPRQPLPGARELGTALDRQQP